ncbi:MAG: YeeE/YedE family protein [Gammaproteobacteria bacterium]|nr:YeeE/YedE family protein [Gammaproteobacteria bacterium]
MMETATRYALHALMGLCMGVILAGIGFADYDELHRMLSLQDSRMLLSFVLSIAVAAVMFLLFKKHFTTQKKMFHPGIIPGSVLFGTGWAICGACPAIVFVQLGLGKLPALMTLVGIFVGVKLYRLVHARYFRWDTGSCST